MGVELYPNFIYEEDLSPDAFGSEIDDICTEIHEACKGWGTNEKRLLKAMGDMTPETRCKVPLRYKEMFGTDLKDVMKSECGSRSFGTALQFLAVDPVSAECDMIQKACQGMGTKETLLYTIISGRSNQEMIYLKKKYFELHTEDLGKKLDAELGGAFEQFIFNSLQAAEEAYDPEFHTEDKMKEDVEKLYKMGQGKWGTDEKGLFKLLCASPSEYLTDLNLLYAEKYGFTLIKAMETELGGDVRDAAVFMLGLKLRPDETVAKLIKEACRGVGTNELLLTCTIIRYQAILKGVMEKHIELFEKTLEDRIKSECGADYRDLLLEIIQSASDS